MAGQALRNVATAEKNIPLSSKVACQSCEKRKSGWIGLKLLFRPEFTKKNSIALSIFLRILKVFWLSNDGIRTQDAFRIRAR